MLWNRECIGGMLVRGQLLGVGNTASVYEWGQSDVIKIFHDASVAHYEAEKEARNAVAIDRLTGVRAPKFKGLTVYEGSTCLIYEKAEGPTMLSQIEANESSVEHYAKLLADLQVELHTVKLDAAPNMKREMENSIRRVGELSDAEKEKLASRLTRLPEGAALCHYDFHPGNIILTADGPMIIDWINALVGHPAADVARTYMLLAGSDVPEGAPDWVSSRGHRGIFAEAYANAYFERSGVMGMQDVEAWLAPTLAVRVSEMGAGAGRQALLAEVRRVLGES
ncbi:aminoglycoside phosphotransferase (APT) family kinase protein [Paenibacillus taihuensis]|uniref:Aminoglycoside phosphotransferase (APT) family kinase protein n=1 Tax=Paenibacillus taihuensis TaxID=1156355 RepID=A0A3D9SDU4_9BACL|nr:aminoglycoside phosphotransferase family protein [Paenibacillus taihuensis]REE92757.1 aminoglycoside phosphotransferase (APT) family kinase protein [Paenibacillus taihuensis]